MAGPCATHEPGSHPQGHGVWRGVRGLTLSDDQNSTSTFGNVTWSWRTSTKTPGKAQEARRRESRQEYFFCVLSDVTTLCSMLKVSCSLCSSASREHLASSTADRAAETLGGTKLDTVRTWKAKQNCLHFILEISELHDCVNFLQTINSITVCKCAKYTSEWQKDESSRRGWQQAYGQLNIP